MPDIDDQQKATPVQGLAYGTVYLTNALSFVLGTIVGSGFVLSISMMLRSERQEQQQAAAQRQIQEQVETFNRRIEEQIQLLQLQVQRRLGADDERDRINTIRTDEGSSRGLAVPQGDHLPDRPAGEDPGW